MLFSHSSMLRYQHTYFLYHKMNNQTNADGNYTHNLSLSHTFFNAAAVITRILGKTIAAVNALWLVSFSLFEYVGLYKNCWCYANTVSAHDKGWVLMFKKGSELAPFAVGSWVGSVVSRSYELHNPYEIYRELIEDPGSLCGDLCDYFLILLFCLQGIKR